MDAAVLGVGVCVLVLAAWGSSGNSASNKSGGGSGGSALSGTISIAVDAFPPSEGNPFNSGYAGQAVWLHPAIFDALTEGTNTGIKPDLATSWTNPTPTTWMFQLRKGVKFSDGEVFNASAAAFTLNYLASSAGKQTVVGSNTPTLKSATVMGPYTLQITTTVPTLDLPGLLVQDTIVAPNAWKQLGPSGFALHPVGTGPYEVTDWSADEVKMRAATGAWRPGKVKNLNFILVPNQSAGFAALESGEVQVLYSPSLSEYQQAEKSSSLRNLTFVAPNVTTFQFLTSPGSPIMNAQVRVALNEAVNRQAIDQLFGKATKSASQATGPGIPGYDPNLGPIPYNPKGAKKLLAAAGFGSGFNLKIAIQSANTFGGQEVFTLVQSELAQIGVHVTYQSLPFAQWLDDFLAGSFPGAQMTAVLYASTPQFDAALPLARGSCIEVPKPLWCTQPQGQLLQAANTATTTQARDAALLKVAQNERIDPPAIWLYYAPYVATVSNSVDASLTQIGSLDFATLARK